MTITRRGLLGAGLSTFIIGKAFAQTHSDDLRELTHDPDQPVLGNPDGDVTLIEFFDYQCPFCRKSYPEIRALVQRDGNVRLVMKDWPIFGEASHRAVQLALGAGDQYEAVHDAILGIEDRQLTPQLLHSAATFAGVNPVDALENFEHMRGRWEGLLTRNERQAQCWACQARQPS